MRRRQLAIVAAFALGASLVGGVAVAVNKGSGQVTACANSKGVLQVLSAKGKCPKGYSKITVNQQGPRGKPGSKGDRGPQGPGAQSSVITGTDFDTLETGPSITVPGTTLTVSTQCAANLVSAVVITGAGDYLVHGTTFVVGAGNDTAANYHPSDDQNVAEDLDSGADQIDYENNTVSGALNSTIGIAAPGLEAGVSNLTTDLLVSAGGTTFTIDVYEALSEQACNATAQVTPASS